MEFRRFLVGLSLVVVAASGCSDATEDDTNRGDPQDSCGLCGGKADTFGFERESYLAVAIVELANTASFGTLDDDVALNRRAAQSIVDRRPFAYIDELDTAPWVGRFAFEKLAKWVTDRDLVPSCGDGEIQPLVETCDDGNGVSGDGCSDRCILEAGQGGFFEDSADLVEGDLLTTSFARPGSFYLRATTYEHLPVSDVVMSVFERADGIEANQVTDRIVTIHELSLLSRSPFVDLLTAAQRTALTEVWDLMEVSSLRPVVVAESNPRPAKEFSWETSFERPGPLLVEEHRPIAEIGSSAARDLATRLQAVPGFDADGDETTVSAADVVAAERDLVPALTPDEQRALRSLEWQFFWRAEPETSGWFGAAYAYEQVSTETSPDKEVLAEFDRYRIGYEWVLLPYWDKLVDTNDLPLPLAVATSDYSFRTFVSVDRRQKRECARYSRCDGPFQHSDISFRRLHPSDEKPGANSGPFLMEHWEGERRIYNRVVIFEQGYEHVRHESTTTELYGTARPHPETGDFRVLGHHSFTKHGGGSYARFKPITPEDPRYTNREVVEYVHPHGGTPKLPRGRYETFHGVVLDVLDSGMLATFDGCTVPMTVGRFAARSEPCPGSTRSVEVSYHDPERIQIVVDRPGGGKARKRILRNLDYDLEGDEILRRDYGYRVSP